MIHRFTNRFPPWPLHFPGEEEEEKWVGRHELHHQKEGKNTKIVQQLPADLLRP
jgi:hypothetical protein